MRWTVEEVARAMGVAPPPGLDPMARLAGVSIDSRSVRPGELFFAIRGPRHDGHSFVAAVLAAGAAAGVVARGRRGDYPETVRARLFEVGDTLAALQALASTVRRAWGRRMVAVAGSVGKTTTKEILAALLAARFRVLKSEGNLNNEYGLPLTLLRLEKEHEAAVVELGISRRGELARLAKIAEPQVGVVICVAAEHLEFFSSVDEIALAERELIEHLAGPQPVAVLNADDARVARYAEIAPGRIVWFGFGAGAAFRAEAVEDRGERGTAFDFVAPAGRARLELTLVGRHNLLNALAALAAASEWGIGADEARLVFPRLEPAAMRGELLRFDAGFTVLNDCYNSSPLALASLVNWLSSVPGYRRRILAAGEMLELGPTAPELHREAGRQAAEKKIDWIIGVGGNAAELVRGAVEAGHPPEQAQFYSTSEDAAHFLAGLITRGDLLLVKGSRGVRMERVIEVLRARYPASEARVSEPVKSSRGGRG